MCRRIFKILLLASTVFILYSLFFIPTSSFLIPDSLFIIPVANAFVGPPTGCSPGSVSCGGLFNVDSSRNIGFGTASPTPTSVFDSTSTDAGYSTVHGYIFAVASTTNPGISLFNTTSNNRYIWSARNFGALQLYRESNTLPGLVVMEISQYGDIGISTRATSTYRLDVGGDVRGVNLIGTFSGGLAAGNVSSGVFGSLQGNGNFAFPAALAVGTSTTSFTDLPARGLWVASSTYLAALSGNVGIGTTTPQSLLAINGSVEVAGNIGNVYLTKVNNSIGTNTGNYGLYWNDTSELLQLTSQGSVRMSLEGGGNFGIATTTPKSLFHIVQTGAADAFRVDDVAADTSYFVIDQSGNVGIATTTPSAVFSVVGSSTISNALNVGAGNLFVSAGGNIGIGTTSPGAALDVQNVTNPFINIQDTSASGVQTIYQAYSTTDARLGTLSNHPLSFYANNSEKMRIQTDGNVGIATTTPGYKLHVVGGIYASGDITAGGTLTANVGAAQVSSGIFGSVAGYGNYTFRDATGAHVVAFLDATNERLGVGSSTSPTATLSVTGSSTISNALNVGSGNFYVSAAGSVGIGTTSPGTLLQISGASDPEFSVTDTTNNAMVKIRAGDSVGRIFTSSTHDLVLSANGANDTQLTIDSGGNVGIASSSPGYTFVVNGGAYFGSTVRVGTPINNNDAATKFYVDDAVGSGGSGTSTASFGTITVTGTSTLVSNCATCKWNLGGVAGAGINLNGYNITGVNKITVTTVDPIYEIEGVKYATYGPSFAGGVKEEYVGKGKLFLVNNESGIRNYEYVIDFSKEKDGSDLWLWRNIIDFSPENLDVFASPLIVSIPISYEISGNKIIFRSVIPNSSFMLPNSIVFSYRLIGKRFDWRAWPTLAEDQTERASLIVK